MINNTSKHQSEQIVFSFGVISDSHIRLDPTPEQDNRGKLTDAITQLRACAVQDDPHGLALLVVTGDLTQNGDPREIEMFREILVSALPLDETALVYVAGNHDKHNRECNEEFHRVFGPLTEDMYDAHESSPDGICSGNRHYVVGGHHFITLDPIKYSKKESIVFSDATKAWLDTTLASITAKEPQAYVYVIAHLPIWDTCYGTTRGCFYATDDLSAILNQYPQVIAFGGHLHFPLNDERAIMQKSFTCMETATLSDMLIDGFDCENVRKGTKTAGNRDFSQGLLVQIDAQGNVRVRRLDFWHRAEIGEPWMLDAPAVDGSHLKRYRPERAAETEAPEAVKNLRAEFGMSEEGTPSLRLTFSVPNGSVPIRKYTVTLTDRASGDTRTAGYMTDFYRYPRPEDMPRKAEISMQNVEPGKYTVCVTAHNCWGRAGEPMICEI